MQFECFDYEYKTHLAYIIFTSQVSCSLESVFNLIVASSPHCFILASEEKYSHLTTSTYHIYLIKLSEESNSTVLHGYGP